jgi:hypothetical protein
VVLDGFTVDGAAGNNGISVVFAHHIRFQNLEVKNWKDPNSSGVFVYADYNEFLNLKVHDSPTGSEAHGVYILGSHNLVDGCDVYNNSGYGIQVYNGNDNTAAHDNIIRNNRVHDNYIAPSCCGGGITLNSGDNNVAYNNLVYQNGADAAISVSYSAGNTHIDNNTTYNNSGGGLHIGNAGGRGTPNTLVTNNTFVRDNIVDRGTGTIFGNNSCDIAGTGCEVVGDLIQLQRYIVDAIRSSQ